MSDIAPFVPAGRATSHAAAWSQAVGRHVSPAVTLWACAFLMALALDRRVAEWVHRVALDQKGLWTPRHVEVVELIKIGGTYPITLFVALVAGCCHALRWRAAGFVALAGAASGLSVLLKWMVGRRRPVVGIRPLRLDPFAGGWGGMIGAEKNLCFPSGHACLAFASAHALAILFPRGRLAFYAVAAVVAVQRISENAHYLSDVVAGAAVGVLAAHATARWLNACAARYALPKLPTV